MTLLPHGCLTISYHCQASITAHKSILPSQNTPIPSAQPTIFAIFNPTTSPSTTTTSSTMVFPQAPLMSWDQLIEDKARALEQTPKATEQLPAYSEAIKGRSKVHVAEKELPEKQSKSSSKSSGKMAALKSILTLGDVQKHNPRYVLEESMTGKPSVARSEKRQSSKSSSSESSSTAKSILTGTSSGFLPLQARPSDDLSR